MRDSLEGSRPDAMPGVRLDKDPTGATAPRRAWPHVAGWLLAIVIVAMVVAGLRSRHASKVTTVGGVTTEERGRTRSQEAYVGSAMTNVIVAGYKPGSHDGDEYDAGATVELIGKAGVRLTVRVPERCLEGPIAARVGRAIRIRADTWRSGPQGTDTELSEDDAVAALCEEAGMRDVARPR